MNEITAGAVLTGGLVQRVEPGSRKDLFSNPRVVSSAPFDTGLTASTTRVDLYISGASPGKDSSPNSSPKSSVSQTIMSSKDDFFPVVYL
jgi:hypothetical protein